MADRTCPRCAKVFDAPYKLRRHFARKTPCDPVLHSKRGDDKSTHACPSCNRTFASKQAKSLHIHEYCKVQDKKTSEMLDQKVQALQQQVAELLQQQKKKVNELPAHTTHNYIVNNNQVTNVDNSQSLDSSYKVLNQVRGNVNHVQGDVNQIQGNVNHVRGDVNQIRGNVNHVRGDVNQIQGNVNHVQGDMNQIRGNMNRIQGNVNQQIANFIPGATPMPDWSAKAPMPGWPAKWPPPQIDPKPFHQGEYFTSLTQLQQASERLTAEDAAACQQGDAKAVSALLMEVLRQVHADPRERNIYLSPDRGDQALVLAPHQWELNTLHEAVRSIFERMVKELSWLPAHPSQHVKTLLAGAKEGFHKKPGDVVQSSNGAMSAHLKNMQTLLQVPGQIKAAEEASWEVGGDPPHNFGHETYEHMELKTTIYRMELDAGVEKEKDVVEERYAELANRAIYSMAWQVQQLRAPNQTAVLLTEDVALIHTFIGWEERPAADIGETMFRRFAATTAAFVQGDEPTPLKPLGRYIETHIAALALEERKSLALLRRYSMQAERVCATSTNPEYVKLRELLRAAKEKRVNNVVLGTPPAIEAPQPKEQAARTTKLFEDVRQEPAATLSGFDILDLVGWT